MAGTCTSHVVTKGTLDFLQIRQLILRYSTVYLRGISSRKVLNALSDGAVSPFRAFYEIPQDESRCGIYIQPQSFHLDSYDFLHRVPTPMRDSNCPDPSTASHSLIFDTLTVCASTHSIPLISSSLFTCYRVARWLLERQAYWSSCTYVPIQSSPTCSYLHIYSGRRWRRPIHGLEKNATPPRRSR
ncbi:hypothetical protein Y032_0026g1443 [Ancylostoma ceylanicum]|uniref:Uncharacterized protein n=1 Tax=Ancylostoma ceylanicum TaxID=53326 RepID=A0A016UUP1_9BILA|nr:hypothetical protein Y032_0026g1443 [Ancylostoma ceylanicum]